jgi:hypothetical protein
MSFRPLLVLAALLMLAPPAAAAKSRPAWKAGVATVSITPRSSLWQAGYAARTRASEGTLHELHAKALALEDRDGRRAVVVTTDLLGLPREVAGRIAERVQKAHRIPRARLLLNASHTHGGPVVGDTLRVAYQGMSEAQWADVKRYTAEMEDRVVECVGKALKELRPARLAFGHSRTDFAGNRRLQFNPNGPVDHDVPVLRVEDEKGALRAVVFGYACHNTTLGGDMYQFHADYAGFARDSLEKSLPGTAAMYVAGCGADANPKPRGTVDLARQHGEALARAVREALRSTLEPVNGPLTCAFGEAMLEFAPVPDRTGWQAKLSDQNVYVRSWAKLMLETLDRDGKLPDRYPCPVQVWRFGKDLTLVAIGGETVVDYALRLKKELGPERLWVAGYSNDVFAYIPSRRVLMEGGYEGADAMIGYGQPGPFGAGVEEIIVEKIADLMRATGRS